MKVINECRINFKYRLSQQTPIINKTIFSNQVSTQVVRNTLEISKYVNKKQTYSFDILTYTIVIENITQITINNLFFQDNIPNGTKFIENSVIVNDIKIRCVNPQEGFYIGKLTGKGKVKITFKVLVLPMCFCKNIINYSTIKYDYIYNVEKPPYRAFKESNSVDTKCEFRLFKQISIGNALKLDTGIYKIIDGKYKFKIIETKVISSPKLNLYTLIVIGKIEYEICYKSNPKCNCKYIEDVFGFSTDMLVPIGITFFNKDKIQGSIEYASANLVNKNTIFINIDLLLYY